MSNLIFIPENPIIPSYEMSYQYLRAVENSLGLFSWRALNIEKSLH